MFLTKYDISHLYQNILIKTKYIINKMFAHQRRNQIELGILNKPINRRS